MINDVNGIHVFGLLHLAKDELSAVNLKIKNFSEQIRVYLNNASLLSKSLSAQGIKFTLLTNDKEKLDSLLSSQSNDLEIKEIEFITKIPTGTRFYSAHSKIDVFRYIGQLDLNYAMYCDIDMICLRAVPKVLKNIISEQIPAIYEVTDQVIPGDGHDFLIKNLEKIHKIKSEGRWIGGEFLGGSSKFFKEITSEIDRILPSYFENLLKGEISNGNDETYTSAAIEVMRRRGKYIADVGHLELVGRYWSSGPRFVQKNFKYFENVFLLHLPADKYFLQKMDKKYQIFDSKVFINEFLKKNRNHRIKSSPRSFLYFLFRVKAKIYGLRSINFNSKLK